MRTLVSDLGGTRRADVATLREGAANLQGFFTLSYNGDETGPIAHDASGQEVEDALNALESIGAGGVGVQRTSGGLQEDFAWEIAFNDFEHLRGDLDSIVVEDVASFYGNGARIVVCADESDDADCLIVLASRRGNEMRGTFTLSLLGHETSPIEFNAADTTVKRRLEELPNVGTVNVVREQTSPEKTYRWTVTFLSNPGAFPAGTGNVAQLESSAAELTTTNGVSGLTEEVDGGPLDLTTTIDGSASLSGTFMLGYDPSDACGDQNLCTYVYTSPLRVDATALEVKSALEEIATVGTVDVSRSLNSNGNGYTWGVTFAACGDHVLENGSVDAVCNRGPLNLLNVDFGGLTGTGTMSTGRVLAGRGSSSDADYGSYAFTDHDSTSPPYVYDIVGLDTGVNYFVRISSHSRCDDTCRRGATEDLGCCGYSYTQVSEPTFVAPLDQSPGRMVAPTLVSSSADTQGFSADITIAWEHPTVTGNSDITGYELWMDTWTGGNWRRVFDGRDKPYTMLATVS